MTCPYMAMKSYRLITGKTPQTWTHIYTLWLRRPSNRCLGEYQAGGGESPGRYTLWLTLMIAYGNKGELTFFTDLDLYIQV